MAPQDHMEVQAHTVLLAHLVPLGLPWVHTTQGLTIRDLQDPSKSSAHLFDLSLKCVRNNHTCGALTLFFFITAVHLRLTSLRDGAMATHTGNKDSLIRVSPCFWFT